MSRAVEEFHNYIVDDILSSFPGITSKRMFGGYGIYKDTIIFAIITGESELYFKVDTSLKETFKKYGSHPFVYAGHKTKKPTEMPYWLLPEEILENEDILFEWIEASVLASKISKKTRA